MVAGQPSRLGGPDVKPAHPQQSPDDSTTSSQLVGGAQSSAAAAARSTSGGLLSGDVAFVQLQTRLLVAARQISRFADCLRRSTNSFQGLIERQDVRDNQHAKLACMHMAVVCMDVGMLDGFQVISHASKALESIRRL